MKKITLLFLLICVFIKNVQLQRQRQDFGFGFPEHESVPLDDSKKNANNRQPLFLPSQCRDNELFYPGDQHDDWVCDCTPGHVYHPESDKCYSVYSKGPCQDRQYLVLAPRRNIPECKTNPCGQEGRVPYQNRCYTINTAGPCILPQLSYVVGVNVTTLQIDCIKQSIGLPNRFDPPNESDEEVVAIPDLPEFIPKCAKGSKRSIEDKCIPSDQLYQLT